MDYWWILTKGYIACYWIKSNLSVSIRKSNALADSFTNNRYINKCIIQIEDFDQWWISS